MAEPKKGTPPHSRVGGALVVFAKVPEAGTAKSRIAMVRGWREADRVYGQLLAVTARVVDGQEYHVAFTDDCAPGSLHRYFPSARSFIAQRGASLGERLRNVFAGLLDQGHSHVCAIGCDCPFLEPSDIALAYRALEGGSDLVLGPALDGGYYLVGSKRQGLAVFSASQWGTGELLRETIAIATDKSLTTTLLRPLSDIDSIEDLHRWIGDRSV